jgi:hypothetical protein
VREYLFDGSTGFFLADRPEGWQWGVAELLPPHVIVRTDKSAFVAKYADLLKRKVRLSAPLKHSGLLNVFLDAALEVTPEEEWIAPPAFVNLRTGHSYLSEPDAMASSLPGDTLFFTKCPNRRDVPGMTLVVLDPDAGTYLIQSKRTMPDEADVVNAAVKMDVDMTVMRPVVLDPGKPSVVEP